MPRKTKEQTELEKEKNVTKKSTKTAAKKTTSSKTSATKKAESSGKTKATTKKAATTSKTKKAATAKKDTKTTTKKKATTAKVKKVDNKKEKVEIVEYYDLPYRYNQTVVKVLAQTPNNLFVYWDISDYDRENYKKEFGENFFETTKPVLIVHNKTFGYSFEVEINDFANSWYLHVNDSKCDYEIELGRHPITKENLKSDYIYVSSSNTIESPNDSVLLDKNLEYVTFRNVKNNNESIKSITDIKVSKNINNIYNIYDLYKLIYDDDNIENYSNPSSNSSSGTFSSK